MDMYIYLSHILPAAEAYRHRTCDGNCWCNPRRTELKENCVLYTHNAVLDQRERSELRGKADA